MQRFFRVLYDGIVFCLFVLFIVGIYKRFWLPEGWFKP